jgi:hypothetical protein
MSLIPYTPPMSFPRDASPYGVTDHVYTGEEFDAHRSAVCVLLAKLQQKLQDLGQTDAAYRVRRLEIICRPTRREDAYRHMRYDAQHVNGWTERALRSLEDVPHYLDPRGRTATDFNSILDVIEQTQRAITCQTK